MKDTQDVSRIRNGRAWEEFCEQLKTAGDQILKNAPDDDFDRAEGLRYLSRLTSTFLKNATSDPMPRRTTLVPMSIKIGLDNPDYIYFTVPIDPESEYRIRGHLGDAHMIGFGTFSGGLGTKEGLVRNQYLESQNLHLDHDDYFEISLSKKQSGENWLPLDENTNSLQIRQTLLKRAQQRPAPLELERLGKEHPPSPLDPSRFAETLDLVGGTLMGTVHQFLGWTKSFAAQPHEIHPIDPALMTFAQGDPNTLYNYSYWDIAEDEAFVIEFTPPACEYWNLQIGNHWLESFDFMHRSTHINHHTALQDANGQVRAVVSPVDPGVPNWLDTAGHSRGTLALRWVGAESLPQTHSYVTKRIDLV